MPARGQHGVEQAQVLGLVVDGEHRDGLGLLDAAGHATPPLSRNPATWPGRLRGLTGFSR